MSGISIQFHTKEINLCEIKALITFLHGIGGIEETTQTVTHEAPESGRRAMLNRLSADAAIKGMFAHLDLTNAQEENANFEKAEAAEQEPAPETQEPVKRSRKPRTAAVEVEPKPTAPETAEATESESVSGPRVEHPDQEEFNTTLQAFSMLMDEQTSLDPKVKERSIIHWQERGPNALADLRNSLNEMAKKIAQAENSKPVATTPTPKAVAEKTDITMEDLRVALNASMQLNGSVHSRKLLGDYGCKRVADMEPCDQATRAEFVALCNKPADKA